jgi:hypothetical protein
LRSNFRNDPKARKDAMTDVLPTEITSAAALTLLEVARRFQHVSISSCGDVDSVVTHEWFSR